MADARGSMPLAGTDQQLPKNLSLSLFVVSVLGLFLEMVLIRWVGTEIRIFAYLQNTILVACVMSLGMSCMTCRSAAHLWQMLVPLGGLCALLALPEARHRLGDMSDKLGSFSGMVIWQQVETQERLLAFVALFVTAGLIGLVWAIFVPIGRWMGRMLAEHPRPIWSYSINVAGSLFGIWLFVGLSAVALPPVVWMCVVGALSLFVLSTGPGRRLVEVLLVGAIIAMSWGSGRDAMTQQVVWSPYQKLSVTSGPAGAPYEGQCIILVNNVSYQAMVDLRPETMRERPQFYDPALAGLSQYDLPWILHPKPRKGLVVGAGSGNDVAGALRHGLSDVIAVEIDPAIIELGRRLHPERPYDSPAVRVVADDARSYFATTNERFDVIVFGLLDSHTTTSMTNARLDHYVYTLESLRRVRELLNDGGVLVLSFCMTREFIADRIGTTLKDVFETEPLCFGMPDQAGYGGGGNFFICGKGAAIQERLAANPRLGRAIAEWQKRHPIVLSGATRPASDDWPYLYLEKPSIPTLYYLLAGMMLLLLIGFGALLRVPGLSMLSGRTSWHFFFLGAAFLLLEVQNISKAAVVLGNTWEVNAVIVSGVLVMILLANAVVGRFPHWSLGPVYFFLCAVCVGLYFVDLSRFAFFPYPLKVAVVGGLTSLPMLFSGVVFARSYRVAAHKDKALGANLIGALCGALLQSITFVTGIKMLLLVVASLYAFAFLTRPRE